MVASRTSLENRGFNARVKHPEYFLLPYGSLGIDEICHPRLGEAKQTLSNPIQFAEFPSWVTQNWVLRETWCEPTTGCCVSNEFTVSFCFFTKASCSSTESGLIPITRRFDPLNASLSVKSGSEDSGSGVG